MANKDDRKYIKYLKNVVGYKERAASRGSPPVSGRNQSNKRVPLNHAAGQPLGNSEERGKTIERQARRLFAELVKLRSLIHGAKQSARQRALMWAVLRQARLTRFAYVREFHTPSSGKEGDDGPLGCITSTDIDYLLLLEITPRDFVPPEVLSLFDIDGEAEERDMEPVRGGEDSIEEHDNDDKESGVNGDENDAGNDACYDESEEPHQVDQPGEPAGDDATNIPSVEQEGEVFFRVEEDLHALRLWPESAIIPTEDQNEGGDHKELSEQYATVVPSNAAEHHMGAIAASYATRWENSPCRLRYPAEDVDEDQQDKLHETAQAIEQHGTSPHGSDAPHSDDHCTEEGLQDDAEDVTIDGQPSGYESANNEDHDFDPYDADDSRSDATVRSVGQRHGHSAVSATRRMDLAHAKPVERDFDMSSDTTEESSDVESPVFSSDDDAAAQGSSPSSSPIFRSRQVPFVPPRPRRHARRHLPQVHAPVLAPSVPSLPSPPSLPFADPAYARHYGTSLRGAFGATHNRSYEVAPTDLTPLAPSRIHALTSVGVQRTQVARHHTVVPTPYSRPSTGQRVSSGHQHRRRQPSSEFRRHCYGSTASSLSYDV
ncbi:hypothetical protein WOLCODRAFT_17979 [Wolfiporia cocos MD-104 SS10]|uniref:Uncharacterized protein n=1 Tax=Wolfiporia cocos (strain MD-104) TaxID=742152 RepID=A0A2H3JMY2_WOLCO|nr:hypothetical protein WOLCODRAFT_17979 [Wolfiporia cocos MD-104 SS10]